MVRSEMVAGFADFELLNTALEYFPAPKEYVCAVGRGFLRTSSQISIFVCTNEKHLRSIADYGSEFLGNSEFLSTKQILWIRNAEIAKRHTVKHIGALAGLVNENTGPPGCRATFSISFRIGQLSGRSTYVFRDVGTHLSLTDNHERAKTVM